MYKSPLEMFTGLIQDIGTLKSAAVRANEATLIIETSLQNIELGESIAVMGACLSVTEASKGSFSAFASAETLTKTGFDNMQRGTRVNLERALKLGDPLGGHLVTGHVDTRVELKGRHSMGEGTRFSFALPASSLADQIAPKGSIAIDGVSLTVNDVQNSRFDVMIIPLTLKDTTLDSLTTGDSVNIETDVLAKYVAGQLGRGREKRGGVDMALLEASGFIKR